MPACKHNALLLTCVTNQTVFFLLWLVSCHKTSISEMVRELPSTTRFLPSNWRKMHHIHSYSGFFIEIIHVSKGWRKIPDLRLAVRYHLGCKIGLAF